MKDFINKERLEGDEIKRHMEKYKVFKNSYVKNIKFEPNIGSGLSMFVFIDQMVTFKDCC